MVSQNISSLKINLSLVITLATIAFSMPKTSSELDIVSGTCPQKSWMIPLSPDCTLLAVSLCLDCVLDYHTVLQPEWDGLPENLRLSLQGRLQDTDCSAGEQWGKSCCISWQDSGMAMVGQYHERVATGQYHKRADVGQYHKRAGHTGHHDRVVTVCVVVYWLPYPDRNVSWWSLIN